GAFFGTGLAWTTTTIVGYITENWFTNSKGTMMGIILAANGLGAFISEPIITKLIYGMDGSLTGMAARWRLAYVVCAVLFLVVGIIVTLLVRDRPEEKGLKPLGQDKVKKNRGLSWTGYEMKEIFRKPFFYISGFCTFAIGFTLQSLASTAKPHMYDLNFSSDFVIPVFMIGSIVLLIAKMTFGILYDRFGIRPTFGICSLAAAIALLALTLLSPERSWLAYVYALIGEWGYPLETVMIPLLVSQLFGRKSYSHVLGYFLALNYLGYAVGVVVTNYLFDLMGTYRQILFVLMLVMIAAGLVSQFSFILSERSRKKFMAEEEAAKAATLQEQ
ncbi:MAG: MFS transporter, partial [Lachnospiraceae bacterium]|nr:MFS transporter [Lachnospiraceae bacterium]